MLCSTEMPFSKFEDKNVCSAGGHLVLVIIAILNMQYKNCFAGTGFLKQWFAFFLFQKKTSCPMVTTYDVFNTSLKSIFEFMLDH